MSSQPASQSSLGINMERAVLRALKGRGGNLVDKNFDPLLEQLTTKFQQMAQAGQDFQVSLAGIKSFRRQGRRFLALLEGLSGVSRVTQKSFRGKTLVVDLKCKCTSEVLQERIFAATQGVKDLASLDVQQVQGKRLGFRL
ncbi:MAG: hypothetical protein R3C68_01245 [Myxococcota bacterium]